MRKYVPLEGPLSNRNRSSGIVSASIVTLNNESASSYHNKYEDQPVSRDEQIKIRKDSFPKRTTNLAQFKITVLNGGDNEGATTKNIYLVDKGQQQ